MRVLGLLAYFHNWLADKDFVWWPFSFLRPEPKEFITMKLVLLMTACFGGLAFLMFTAFAIVNNMFSLDSAILTFFSCFVGFFLWFGGITKPLWNHRAKQLRK